MPSRSRLLATVVAIVAALTISAVLGLTRLGSADAESGPVAGTALMRLGSSWSLASNQDKYRYVIVGRGSAAQAAAQPGMSLVYHSGTSVNTSWDAGVPYSVASANGWLLRDAAGNFLKNTGYPDNFIGDVGNAAYANEWARRVGDYLSSVGADGAYIDDVVADIYALSGTYPAKYPNQASWENAMTTFIQIIGPALKARGFYVLLNAHKWISGNGASDTGALEAEWWQRLGPYVSGLHNEYFIQNPINTSQLRGEGSAWYDNWSGWTNLINVTQGMGRDFFGMTYGSTSDTQSMRFVRASFLLFWNGGGGGVLYQVDDGDPWSTEWTADIGTPAGGRTAVGVGWRRQYSGGTVLVNPSTSSSQAFALGGTYLMPDGSAVTSATLAPKSGLVLRSTGATVPVNTALPTVTGTPQQGVLLSSTTGTWSGSPTSFTRQWQRCDAAGSGCVAITGATSTQYALTATDLGKRVRVNVTATNASGSASAASTPTAVVVASPPANVSLPSISGSTVQGETLTASAGTWTNSPSYAYQWQRCDSGGNACAPIVGATGTTYALVAADVGSRHRVAVTGSNGGGSATVTSAASTVVTAAAPAVQPPANTALPSISGSTVQGQTLTASAGTWTNSPSYAYQWQRCDSGGNACAPIVGATGTTYALVAADVGSRHRVAVTGSNGGGSATVTSAASTVVTAAAPAVQPPANTALPSISGSTVQGQTLTVANGSWSNAATSYAYQWRRCDSGGGACVDVGGATTASYVAVAGDVGRTLRVAVTASNAVGSASATSSPSGVVAPLPAAPPAAPVNMTPPAVTGTAQVTRTLTASNGSWSNAPTSYAYQWRRCDTGGGGCVNLNGANASSYSLVSADVGRTLRVAVNASNPGGSASATSGPSGVVAAAAPASTPPAPALTVATAGPADGATVSATLIWEAKPSAAVSEIDFLVDGTSRWQERKAPYFYGGTHPGGLDTRTLSNGVHTLTVRAVGLTGAKAEATISVKVANGSASSPPPPPPPPPPPALTVATAGPADGATVSATLIWEAKPSAAVSEIDFLVDGTSRWQERKAPYFYGGTHPGGLDTRTLSNGVHTLTVRAVGLTGAKAEATISVKVANGSVPPPTIEAVRNIDVPTVTGRPQEGRTIETDLGRWEGSPGLLVVQWLRCLREDVDSCQPIVGATDARYTIVADDVDRFVVSKVTALGSWGSVSATSEFGRAIR